MNILVRTGETKTMVSSRGKIRLEDYGCCNHERYVFVKNKFIFKVHF